MVACESLNDVIIIIFVHNIGYIAWYICFPSVFTRFPGFAAVESHQATNPPSEATASWVRFIGTRVGHETCGVQWGPGRFHHMPRIIGFAYLRVFKEQTKTNDQTTNYKFTMQNGINPNQPKSLVVHLILGKGFLLQFHPSHPIHHQIVLSLSR